MDETTTAVAPKKRRNQRRVSGKRYNWTRIATVRMSAAQYESLTQEAEAARLSINEIALERLFPEGHQWRGDHLPKAPPC